MQLDACVNTTGTSGAEICAPVSAEGGRMACLKSFVRDQSGATAIEYGLIAAGIAIAIIASVQGIGTKLSSTFSSISAGLK
jgi:pilus assembly protein Flp/PilA